MTESESGLVLIQMKLIEIGFHSMEANFSLDEFELRLVPIQMKPNIFRFLREIKIFFSMKTGGVSMKIHCKEKMSILFRLLVEFGFWRPKQF